MEIMQPEIISRETIKPSSPTPYHLKSYKLSLLHQLSPRIYMPVVFFYPNEGCNGREHIPKRSSMLKKSLSQTLTHYYPFAGRIKDSVSIDCNDEGVDFVEAQIKCELFEVLKHLEVSTLNLFLPGALQWKDSDMANVLRVQINFFDCGGMAIGVCISHKIADTATMSTFMNEWAAMARPSPGEKVLAPEFIAASVFPPSHSLTLPETEVKIGNYVTRRFVFEPSKLTALKAMTACCPKLYNPRGGGGG